mmetsp:Transcript_7568/g.16769  ORF Transcript_7568/g.16769 Transcript_7568/m.16769 type:complete len:817 (+) Transcript_7568:10-2460(+)
MSSPRRLDPLAEAGQSKKSPRDLEAEQQTEIDPNDPEQIIHAAVRAGAARPKQLNRRQSQSFVQRKGSTPKRGSIITQQIERFMEKVGKSNQVAPVHEDLEDQDDHPPVPKKRVPLKERALLGKGSEEDAERSAFTLIMMLATLFALWGNDLYELAGPPPKSSDTILYTFVLVVFLLFMIEFSFYSLFKPGYVGSFFFYLDFLAAVSLLPDVLLLWEIELFASGGGGLAVARAGRAARAGTRAARVVRIFKLFSLVRRSNNTKKKMSEQGTSRIGAAVKAGITQKVIMIVAIMLISTQLLELIVTSPSLSQQGVDFRNTLDNMEMLLRMSGNDTSKDPFYNYTVEVIDFFNDPDGNCPEARDFVTRGFDDVEDCKIRHLRIGGRDIFGDEFSYSDLRTTPTERLVFEQDENQMVLETIKDAQSEALNNLITVLFVTILLAFATTVLSSDSDRIVIGPLETMTSMVRTLAHDPLGGVEIEDEEELVSETREVAHAILKLSSMLQVGFGDAGATIIQANMSSDSSDINPVIPGKRINAIFGFCDIRNFTDCTECLRVDVMYFVNRIAMFVHYAVKENEGTPNKNIGDAFLMAWPLPDRGHGKRHITTADAALRSFVRIVVETANDSKLKELTDRKEVQDRMPGYATKFGLGLHAGYGIEGAIGSVLKIDATYLSPNVNMSARLEGATKTYSCVMLITDTVYDMFTPEVQRLCRRVDRVTAKGANTPTDLYTYDVVRHPDQETMKNGHTFWERFPPAYSLEFIGKFNEGIKNYISGDWAKATEILKGVWSCLAHGSLTPRQNATRNSPRMAQPTSSSTQ